MVNPVLTLDYHFGTQMSFENDSFWYTKFSNLLGHLFGILYVKLWLTLHSKSIK